MKTPNTGSEIQHKTNPMKTNQNG